MPATRLWKILIILFNSIIPIGTIIALSYAWQTQTVKPPLNYFRSVPSPNTHIPAPNPNMPPLMQTQPYNPYQFHPTYPQQPVVRPYFPTPTPNYSISPDERFLLQQLKIGPDPMTFPGKVYMYRELQKPVGERYK